MPVRRPLRRVSRRLKQKVNSKRECFIIVIIIRILERYSDSLYRSKTLDLWGVPSLCSHDYSSFKESIKYSSLHTPLELYNARDDDLA